jgi:hypothetical protein
MNHSFEKFKKRLILHRILRAAMLGCACGVALSGLALLMSKRNILPFEPAFSILIGLCAMLVVFGIVFLLGKKSDSELARELDETFGLSARVATMVEYSGEKGDMLDMQRQDADERLSEIPLSKFKFKRLWVCIVALLLSAAMLTVGIVTENIRGYMYIESHL